MSALRARPGAVLALGLALVAAAVLASLAIGVIDVPLADVARVLVDALAGRDDGSTARTLVVEMRLPRAFAAACVGASLGSAGCLLQALLRDPLASPSLIGTAQAAGFGRVLGVWIGLGFAASVALSIATAVAGTALVLAIARTRRGFPSQIVLLTGVNVGLLFGALIGLVQYASRDEGQLSRMVIFLLGGLGQVAWTTLAWTAPFVLVGLVLARLLARRLDLFALGEESADRLGLATRTSGNVVLVVACALTSLAVSVAGVIAFVGLVVPHAARRIVGTDHRVLLPASAALGALLVLGTDAVARTAVAPNELPLGVLTSLVGVPCFLAILRASARRGGGS